MSARLDFFRTSRTVFVMTFTGVLFSCYREKIIAKVIRFGKRLTPVNTYNVGFLQNLGLTCSTVTGMEDIYDPPKNIRGMKMLDRNAITKAITVPCLVVDDGGSVEDIIKLTKKYMLKIKGIKPVQALEGTRQRILIDAKKIGAWNDLDENTLKEFKKLNVTADNFLKVPLELKYENWMYHDILSAILPENEPFTSFSIVGHIIHLNIKDHLLEFKNVIGEVLLDKISVAKTVVYKKSKIDSVYRNFEMEVLCGEHNFIASVKENQCVFKLDFSKVYWNPRLGTEHLRVVDKLREGDVVFDVFAGVGPFSIPAAKKKCTVFANDLNPESVKWLEHNITLNKRAEAYISVFNKDGGDFILKDVKENLIKTFEKEHFNGKIHFVMNLPGIAPTFIRYLKGLITESDFVKFDVEQIKKSLPIVHCYFFTLQTESTKSRFEEDSGLCLNDVEHSFHFVRAVSNSKSMYRITFTVPINYLMAVNAFNKTCEPLHKRIRTN